MRCGLACGSLALLDLANTISVNHYLLLYIMQCLLVGIEIIHEKTPACSSTHTPSRKACNATVGRNRLMTHYSCLDELRIQKKTLPIGKSNKLEAGREKNKGSEWKDYALVSASYTHNRLFWTVWKKKISFTENRTNKFASLPSRQLLQTGESHLLTPAVNLSWTFGVIGQTSIFSGVFHGAIQKVPISLENFRQNMGMVL